MTFSSTTSSVYYRILISFVTDITLEKKFQLLMISKLLSIILILKNTFINFYEQKKLNFFLLFAYHLKSSITDISQSIQKKTLQFL